MRYGQDAFGIVTIEGDDADIVLVGKIDHIDINAGLFRMTLVTPDAEWESESETLRLNEVRRVDLGGSYEEAMLLIASA